MEISLYTYIGIKPTILSKIALDLPITSFIDLIVSDYDRKRIRVSEQKENVLEYIGEKKRVTIFEITDKFKITLDEVALILKELESERKIKLNGL